MRAVVVAGSGRSGTTWVAELIAEMVPSRFIFEPFHSRVPLGQMFAFRYQRPGDRDPQLRRFWELCLKGLIASKWVRDLQKQGPPANAVSLVKAIRANLMLAWVRQVFAVPVVYIVRDPRAVVASRIRLKWDPGGPLASMLEQPTLLGDHLTPELLEIARNAETVAARHAAQWAIENRVVQRQAKEAGIPILRYEELLQGPQVGLPAIHAAIGMGDWCQAARHYDRPSKTAWPADEHHVSTLARLERWKVDLCAKDIRMIDAVVDAFGLREFMREEP